MESNANEAVVTVKQSMFHALQEKSEARRQAMCDVVELIKFIFGENGIPQSKAALIRRLTTAIMNSEALEAKMSRFSAENIDNFLKLCEK